MSVSWRLDFDPMLRRPIETARITGQAVLRQYGPRGVGSNTREHPRTTVQRTLDAQGQIGGPFWQRIVERFLYAVLIEQTCPFLPWARAAIPFTLR